MAAELGSHFGERIRTNLEGGARGVFDVTVGGKRVFSKHAEHRFPDPHEIIAAIEAQLP